MNPSSESRDGQAGLHARTFWRHTEDPLIVEATEIAAGWRHLTILHPAGPAEICSPELGRLFAEFARLRGLPHTLCGGSEGDLKRLVVGIGPPGAETEIGRLHDLAAGLNPGTWRISLLGRPVHLGPHT